jgi:hypothetical protein
MDPLRKNCHQHVSQALTEKHLFRVCFTRLPLLTGFEHTVTLTR